jgi:phosphotriesterase-related protein
MRPEQADLLISERADPGHIVIGHICGSANKGVYISFDRLGLDTLFPDTLRKACIIVLVSMGCANRIILSHDHILHFLGRIPDLPDLVKVSTSNCCYTQIFRDIIPALKEAGITDDKIDTVMVNNPRELFA